MSLFLWTIPPIVLLHVAFFMRRGDLLRFQLVLDVLLVVILGPALIGANDLNPIRCLRADAPFRHVAWSPATQNQPTQSDLVYYFHPWWEEAGRQLSGAGLPRIEPGAGGGLPLLANGQIGLWAPMMVPVWLHGPERGTTIMALWKVEFAGLGAFLFFANGLRLRWTASAFGGVAWAGTPYLVGWLLVPLAWSVAALPWIWWAVWWLARRRTPGWGAAAVGLGFGWLLGAGLHPETSAIVCGSGLLLAVCLRPRRPARAMVVAVVGGVVASVLAWPTLGYIQGSSRSEIVGEREANRDGLPLSIKRDLVRQIAVPASMGHPARGDWRAAYPQSVGAAGVGGAVLALLAAGPIRRRYRRLAAGAGLCAALGLILLIRIPPLDDLLVRVPPLNHMTIPRFGVLIPWGLVVLAALSLDGALRGRPRSVPIRLVPAILIFGVALWSAPWQLDLRDLGLVVLSVLAALAVALLRPRRALVLVAVVELALLAVGINPVAAAADRLPRPELLDRLVGLEAAAPSRVIGIDGALRPNLASRYGLRDLRAADPLRPRPFVRLMGVLGEPPTVLGGPLRRAPAGLCGAWGVGWAVTPPGAELTGWRREYGDRNGVIWSNPLLLSEVRVVGRTVAEPADPQALLRAAEAVDFATEALVARGAPSASATSTAVDVDERTPSSLRASVACDGPCLLVLAQPWAPGWQAAVDGRPTQLVLANIAGLGVWVPAGRHSVVLDYRPWQWHTSLHPIGY